MQTENVLNLDETDHVWRVFRRDYFVSDVSSRCITLVRPSLWDDPFENFLEKCKFRLSTGEPVDASPVLARFFGQCWTTAEQESDATWRIYSPNKDGIRVRSSITSLAAAMWNPNDRFAALKYFLGRVTYAPRELINAAIGNVATEMLTGGGGRNLVQTLLVKRREFEHEKEMRLLFYDSEDQFAGKKVWSFPVEPNAVFEEAVFDPRMTDAEVIECTRKLRSSGFDGPISQSELYRPPSWDITLA